MIEAVKHTLKILYPNRGFFKGNLDSYSSAFSKTHICVK